MRLRDLRDSAELPVPPGLVVKNGTNRFALVEARPSSRTPRPARIEPAPTTAPRPCTASSAFWELMRTWSSWSPSPGMTRSGRE